MLSAGGAIRGNSGHTRGEGLHQLGDLVLLGDAEGVKVAAAADLELSHITVLLDRDRC